jgi:hypothetical protein
MPDITRRKKMLKVEPKKAIAKTKKPMARLDKTKRAGVPPKTFKAKSGVVYLNAGAMNRANAKFDNKARKVRESDPSIGKGSDAEKKGVKRRKALGK